MSPELTRVTRDAGVTAEVRNMDPPPNHSVTSGSKVAWHYEGTDRRTYLPTRGHMGDLDLRDPRPTICAPAPRRPPFRTLDVELTGTNST